MVRSRACEATWHISTYCSLEFLMFLLCQSQGYPWRCLLQYGNSAHIILDQRFSYAGTHLKFIKYVVYGKHRLVGDRTSIHVINSTFQNPLSDICQTWDIFSRVGNIVECSVILNEVKLYTTQWECNVVGNDERF